MRRSGHNERPTCCIERDATRNRRYIRTTFRNVQLFEAIGALFANEV
jgi:hypothetical protein